MYNGQVEGWTARHSGSIPRRRKILYFTAFILAVGPGKPPIEGVSGTLIPGESGRGVELITYIYRIIYQEPKERDGVVVSRSVEI
jgi:hypothetical protein